MSVLEEGLIWHHELTRILTRLTNTSGVVTWVCQLSRGSLPNNYDKFAHFSLNPLTAGVGYISFLHFLLAPYQPAFKPGKDKTWHYSAKCLICWPPFCQIWTVFIHLKLWVGGETILKRYWANFVFSGTVRSTQKTGPSIVFYTLI